MGPAGPSGDSGGTFKLLAKAYNYTRVAEHTFTPLRAVETWLNNTAAHSSTSSRFRVDIIQSTWPTIQPTEIIFVAKSPVQAFCVGGSSLNNGSTPAVFNRAAGTIGTAFCTDSRVRPGTTGQPIPENGPYTAARSSWIRLKINETAMIECLSQTDAPRDLNRSPGMTGYNPVLGGGVTCHYEKIAGGTTGDWSGNLTSIAVQEAATAETAWDWEIYYR